MAISAAGTFVAGSSASAAAGALPAVDDPLDWVRLRRERVIRTLEIATAGVPRPVLSLGDGLSHLWLRATANPWQGLIRSVEEALDRPGVALMNLCYEWGCTTGTRDVRGRPAMARTVDWPFVGIGSLVAVTIERTRHGPVAFVTWPGFIGAVTAFAPGRFAIAVNKAPLPLLSHSLAVDRVAGAVRAFLAGGLPITHLLRQVALEAPDFATAVRDIAAAGRVTAPGLVVACGVEPGELAVIERFRTRAVVHRETEGGLCVANDWLTPGRMGWPPAKGNTPAERVEDCRRRITALRELFPTEADDFSWVEPPILNDNTRAALFCSPAEERLVVQGFDVFGQGSPRPATTVLDLGRGALAA